MTRNFSLFKKKEKKSNRADSFFTDNVTRIKLYKLSEWYVRSISSARNRNKIDVAAFSVSVLDSIWFLLKVLPTV